MAIAMAITVECLMLAAFKLAIWVRLTFAVIFPVIKFGECHVWRSIFVCKHHYIWRVLLWRMEGAS